MRASVAMAVFNGEKYIDQQIRSIQRQLTDDDELVISDNVSSDGTLGIVNGYAEGDPRIKVFTCETPGVKENFTNAVLHCGGSYIFFSDQDDVWLDGKLEKVLDRFRQSGASLVVHDARYTDADLNPLPLTIFEERRTSTGLIRNIIKGGYFGCCMAFASELIPYVFPVPGEVPSYDMWTGLIAGIYGKVVLLDEELLYHRRHESNMTPEKHAPLAVMAKYRIALVKSLIKRRRQIGRTKRQ